MGISYNALTIIAMIVQHLIIFIVKYKNALAMHCFQDSHRNYIKPILSYRQFHKIKLKSNSNIFNNIDYIHLKLIKYFIINF